MRELCEWLEQTAFSQWVVGSPSIWAYPTILFLHSVGMLMVAGICAAIDIRILGIAPGIPLKPLERLYPLMWVGFAISAATGTAMTVADATTKLYNPDFWVKMACIFAAVTLLVIIRRRIFNTVEVDHPVVSSSGRQLAWASLFFWFAAIVAGRLLAYLGPVAGTGGLTNR